VHAERHARIHALQLLLLLHFEHYIPHHSNLLYGSLGHSDR